MTHRSAEALFEGTLAADLLAAARNAALICLGAQKQEVATLVTDDESREGMAAIAAALIEAGVEVHAFILEELGRRPITGVPKEIIETLEASQISVFWSMPLPGELKSRKQILLTTSEHMLRHAHLIGLPKEHFIEGLQVDYRTVRALQERLVERLDRASTIRFVTPGGTSLVAPLPPERPWVCLSGIIQPGQWQNLPSGQIMGVPADVEGTFVADASMGDWFGPKYRELEKYPLTLEIEGGRLRDARSPNQKLAREFLLYARSNPNSDRVGELSLGTNLGLRRFTGLALVDENVPGCHLALGNPLPELTGATWESKTHVSVIGRRASVYLDEAPIMEDGVYAHDLVGGTS